MNIDYLHEFVVLAEAGHYHEAAGRLYIAQSTLSKHIKSLEEELGVPLFIRTTRKVELSEHGKLLLPYAGQIVELKNAFTEALGRNLEDGRSQLTLGAIPALAPYGITGLLARFSRDCPEYRLEVIQEGSARLRELLREGGVELAFIQETGDHGRDGLIRVPYLEDELAVVLPAGHPLAGLGGLSLSALAREEFILPGEQTLHDLCILACHAAGFTPSVAYTDHRAENVMDLVRGGMGVGLLMRRPAEHAPREGISVIPVTPAVTAAIHLCYRRDRALTGGAERFLRCLKAGEKAD